MNFEEETKLWTAVVTSLASLGMAIKWWYHMRKLRNTDITDGEITQSVGFLITQLRAEIDRGSQDRIELRLRISALEKQNEEQRVEMEMMRALTACRLCGAPR